MITLRPRLVSFDFSFVPPDFSVFVSRSAVEVRLFSPPPPLFFRPPILRRLTSLPHCSLSVTPRAVDGGGGWFISSSRFQLSPPAPFSSCPRPSIPMFIRWSFLYASVLLPFLASLYGGLGAQFKAWTVSFTCRPDFGHFS